MTGSIVPKVGKPRMQFLRYERRDDVAFPHLRISRVRQRHSPHKRPLGAERKRKTPPREKFADKSGRRGAQTVRGCSSVGTRHCYINKRGSSRHRGFIGFQFAPNRTLPFLCHPSPFPSPINLPASRRELSFPQRSRNHPRYVITAHRQAPQRILN